MSKDNIIDLDSHRLNLKNYYEDELQIEYEKETSIIMPIELLAYLIKDPLVEYKLDKGHTIMYDDITDDIIITDEKTGQEIYLDVILYSRGVFTNGEIDDEQE